VRNVTYVTRIAKLHYRGADKSLARPGRKQATATEDLMLIYPIYNNNWRNISIIYIYIYIYEYKTRLASNKIFSPSNKIHREVGRAKDLSAPLYSVIARLNLKVKRKRHPIEIGRAKSHWGRVIDNMFTRM